MAAVKPDLKLEEAKPEDAAALTQIFFSGFHTNPFFRECFPKTPGSVEAFDKCMEYGINDRDYTRTLKVTNVSNGEIVGGGRWVLPRKESDSEHPAEEEIRWGPIMDHVEPELAGALFESFATHRHGMMKDRRHYYMELLFTAEKYQRSGAGSKILEYGVKMADADQLECYIDASEAGKPLYEKFGFVFTEQEKMPRYDFNYSYGIREPK